MTRELPIVSFVAPSGTGKTTFLERLIPALRARGVRVMAIKHDVHRFDVDRDGKDTARLTAAGAARVLIANRQKLALMAALDGEVPLRTLVERYARDVDLVLTEGYRGSAMPKLLVHRSTATPRRPWPDGTIAAIQNLVAVVGDTTPDEVPEGTPRLPLDDAGPCADFLVERFLPRQPVRRLTGVVLAGGHSRRMGEDKASLVFADEPLLPRVVQRLRQVCDDVIVVARTEQELPALPDDVRVLTDLLPDLGPLGGLLTGLAAARTPFVFLAACDLPHLDPELVRWLAAHPARADVLLPQRDGHAEPTHAIYGAACLAAIKGAVLSGELGMGSWLGSVRVERIPEEAWRAVDPGGRSFLNVNTPEDLERARGL